ncbi:MAG TPA: aminotransferase class I/II-fold pyridoxal phosphate-dependent enzyme [Gammaproteobacteria bacterium]
MSSLEEFAAERLRALERRRLRRRLAVTERLPGARARGDDADLISFACNDYLGFAHHPDVIEASVAATRRYGTGAGAARLITGNHPLYAELERKLAAWKGTEDCVVFGSGYLTNVGVVPALVGAADLVLVDELAHSCLLTGAALSRARVLQFRHNDAAHAAELLGRHRDRHRHCLILTEGVFSMDGDLAPLPALAELARAHDAWLLTDDAHALGVLGAGRGAAFAWSPPVPVPLQMGTLSKALGAYGGYLCTSRAVAELVRNRARSFVYSTGLPPGVVAAAAKALDLLADDPGRAALPLARARAFTAALGLPAAASAVVPLVLGSAERALAASAALQEGGFLVPAIRPPTVPPGTARLRVAFSAEHSEADVRRLAAAAAPLLEPEP